MNLIHNTYTVSISNMIMIVCVLTHYFHFALESFTNKFHKMRRWQLKGAGV